MKEIDYVVLLANVSQMINLLEYDSMRSAGKCKLNATTLADLYELKDRYETLAKPAKKTPNKEV